MEKLKGFFSNLKPWQYIVAVGVVVIGLWAMRNRGSGEGEKVPVSSQVPSSGAGGSSPQYEEVSGKLYEITDSLQKTIADQNKKIEEQQKAIDAQSNTFSTAYNNLANAFASYQSTTQNILAETSRSFEQQQKTSNTGHHSSPSKHVVYDESAKVYVDTRDSEVIGKNESDVQKRVDASKEVSVLQTRYMNNYNKYMSDGKISETEKAVLDQIHNQAEKVGTSSGLGAGGVDGSKRKTY